MEAKYIKQIKNIESVNSFFNSNEMAIPKGFESFFETNNGGRPIQNSCILSNGEEKVVNVFLSFNEEDKENIYKAKTRVVEDCDDIIPFAMDPAGNYFCIKGEKVVFYDHEDGMQIEAANSFIEFIEKLK